MGLSSSISHEANNVFNDFFSQLLKMDLYVGGCTKQISLTLHDTYPTLMMDHSYTHSLGLLVKSTPHTAKIMENIAHFLQKICTENVDHVSHSRFTLTIPMRKDVKREVLKKLRLEKLEYCPYNPLISLHPLPLEIALTRFQDLLSSGETQ